MLIARGPELAPVYFSGGHLGPEMLVFFICASKE